MFSGSLALLADVVILTEVMRVLFACRPHYTFGWFDTPWRYCDRHRLGGGSILISQIRTYRFDKAALPVFDKMVIAGYVAVILSGYHGSEEKPNANAGALHVLVVAGSAGAIAVDT